MTKEEEIFTKKSQQLSERDFVLTFDKWQEAADELTTSLKAENERLTRDLKAENSTANQLAEHVKIIQAEVEWMKKNIINAMEWLKLDNSGVALTCLDNALYNQDDAQFISVVESLKSQLAKAEADKVELVSFCEDVYLYLFDNRLDVELTNKSVELIKKHGNNK